jgi:Major Facilitator Superfamily
MPGGPPPERSDRRRALAAIYAFSLSLGCGTLILPLLALQAGYGAATIGLLTATSAVSQFLLRLTLPRLLARYPDRGLITLSCLMMASSYLMLIGSVALPVFVVAELFQGGARALFWTSSQTHAVRTPGVPIRMLAQVGAVGNFGTMTGPVLTGLIATVSMTAALSLGVVAALVGAALAVGLRRIDPYPRRTGERSGRIWLRPGVDIACWAAFTGGGWRALMNSYVPVILSTAGLPAGIVGGMMTLGELAATVTITALVRIRPSLTRVALVAGVVATGTGLTLVPLVAGEPILAASLLILAGAGAGPLTSLAPGFARSRAEPEEEGEAIALVGTFRAGALLATPTGVAIGLSILALVPAMMIAGLAIAAPAIALTARSRT